MPHGLATLIRPMYPSRDFLAVCAFASTETVIHEAITQPDNILGFCQNHFCDKKFQVKGSFLLRHLIWID
jgi:hypothetical protein